MFSMTDEQWSRQQAGSDCPFCKPRPDESPYWSKVASLSVSSLYLHKVQTYRGYSLLIFDARHTTRPSELSAVEWSAFCDDLHRSQAAVESAVKPDHINVAALGNQIAHLHWHIIPRFKNDPRWGGPIWMTTEEEMDVVALAHDESRSLLETIRAAL